MEEDARSKTVSDLLMKLKGEFRRFLHITDEEVTAQEICLQEMKRSGYELARAIREACEAGNAVIVHSDRVGGRSDVIRTLGRLNPAGITVYYSSEPHATACRSTCTLLAATSVKIVPPLEGSLR